MFNVKDTRTASSTRNHKALTSRRHSSHYRRSIPNIYCRFWMTRPSSCSTWGVNDIFQKVVTTLCCKNVCYKNAVLKIFAKIYSKALVLGCCFLISRGGVLKVALVHVYFCNKLFKFFIIAFFTEYLWTVVSINSKDLVAVLSPNK